MRAWRTPRSIPLWLSVALIAGCSDAGPKTYEVSGRVTWNGAPLGDGEIIFAAADGSPIEDHGTITGGTYRLRAKPGRKLVRIYATRRAGDIDPVMGEAKQEQYIPERYNTQTELEREVGAEGKNQFDFALASAR